MTAAPPVADYDNEEALIRALRQREEELKWAVHGQKIEWVEEVIANGLDVNLMSNQMTLIDSIKLLSPKSPYPSNIMMDIFDLLLNSGADVNIPDPDYDRTPLMYAADIGNVICVRKLIDKGADISTANKRGYTACTIAAGAGNVDVLKCLIEDNNFDKDFIDRDGCSVLYCAVGSRKIEAVRYLLNLGVAMTKSILQECRGPCFYCKTNLPYLNIEELDLHPYIRALKSGRLDMVRLMEEYGCQVHTHPYALSCAVSSNRVDSVDYLLRNYRYPMNYEYIKYRPEQCGFNIIPMFQAHHTFLTDAFHHIGHDAVEVVNLLLDHGADPNKKRGVTQCISAINVAIYMRHVEVIARFIRVGANVNAKSIFGRIGAVLPFEAAVWDHYNYAAQMLFASGSSFGVYSLPEALVKLSPDMQELLREWNVHENNVLPLQKRCRMVILNHLCPQADKKITELPLPPFLIKYLGIPELDDIMEASKRSPQTWRHELQSRYRF